MTIAPSPAPLHVVLTALGTAGDVFPFIAIGCALRARGHQVTVLSSAVFEADIIQAGLGFHCLLGRDTALAMLANPDLWHPRKGLGAAWNAQCAAFERIPQFMASLPAHERCLMLCHPVTLPAAALARALRPELAVVAGYLAPSNMRSCRDPMMLGEMAVPRITPQWLRRLLWRFSEATLVDPYVLPSLNHMRAQHGLAPVPRFWDHMMGVAQFSVGLFPDWFAPPQADWPQPFAGATFPLYQNDPLAPVPARLQAFLDGGDAPIVFTPGSGYIHGRHYFSEALAAVLTLKRRAIFLTAHREQLPPELPDCVLWQDFLPLRAVLAHSAVLVHHGGIGTLGEALRAGVPQLVVPCAHDQFDNAQRARELGVAEVIKMRNLSAARLAGALRRLLDTPAVARQCRVLAARLDGPPDLAGVCAQVELVASAAPGVGALV